MRLLFLLPLFSVALCYKIAILTPGLSNSQVMFNKRVSEALADAGHDVTMVLIQTLRGFDPSDIKIHDNVKVYVANATSKYSKEEFENGQAKMIYNDIEFYDPRGREMMNLWQDAMHESCKNAIRNNEFMTWLEESKFDVAFSHMYQLCPIGIIKVAKIPSWVWLNSGLLMDYVATTLGVPTIPSYQPPVLMEAADKMNLYERTKSFIGHSLMYMIYPWMMAAPETAIFKEEYGQDFPDLLDIAKECPLVMVNSNDMYQIPRATLAKVINIGGLGVDFAAAKPLTGDFKTIAESSKGTIVMSFGSVAAAHLMPQAWKEAICGAFAKFPQYNFVMRYAADDLKAIAPKNLLLSKWLPQADLLNHNNTKAFITHGGYNSLQEAITAGIPLVAIPLFGDQPKNAKLIESRKWGLTVKKAVMSEAALVAAIEKILSDDSYSRNIKRLSKMVEHQPISPNQLLVRWTEFLAEFQTLDNLVPGGQDLNILQYHSVDVIVILVTAVVLVLFVVYKVVAFVVRRCCACFGRGGKTKTD